MKRSVLALSLFIQFSLAFGIKIDSTERSAALHSFWLRNRIDTNALRFKYALLEFEVRDAATNAVIPNIEIRNERTFQFTFYCTPAGVTYIAIKNDSVDGVNVVSKPIHTKLIVSSKNYISKSVTYPDDMVFSGRYPIVHPPVQQLNAGSKSAQTAKTSTGNGFWLRYECPVTIYLQPAASFSVNNGNGTTGEKDVISNKQLTMTPGDSLFLTHLVHAFDSQMASRAVADSVMVNNAVAKAVQAVGKASAADDNNKIIIDILLGAVFVVLCGFAAILLNSGRKIAALEANTKGVREDVGELKTDVHGIKTQIEGFRELMSAEISNLKKLIDLIRPK